MAVCAAEDHITDWLDSHHLARDTWAMAATWQGCCLP